MGISMNHNNNNNKNNNNKFTKYFFIIKSTLLIKKFTIIIIIIIIIVIIIINKAYVNLLQNLIRGVCELEIHIYNCLKHAHNHHHHHYHHCCCCDFFIFIFYINKVDLIIKTILRLFYLLSLWSCFIEYTIFYYIHLL